MCSARAGGARADPRRRRTASRGCWASRSASRTCRSPSRCWRRCGSSSGAWTTRASARCRRLQPLVTFAVTVPLAAATGLGVWSLVVGQLAGYLVACAVALALSPYALALRFDRAVARRYLTFCAWVFVALVAAMVVVQGQVLAFEAHGGLAAVGFITLAATLTRYVDRADQIVTATIYPAVCAMQGPHARARGAVREVQPRDAALTRRRSASASLLFAPDLVGLRARRRVGPGRRAAPGPGRRRARWRRSASTGSRSTAPHGDTRPPAIEATVGRGRPSSRSPSRARAVGHRRLRRRADRRRGPRARRGGRATCTRCCRACGCGALVGGAALADRGRGRGRPGATPRAVGRRRGPPPRPSWRACSSSRSSARWSCAPSAACSPSCRAGFARPGQQSAG